MVILALQVVWVILGHLVQLGSQDHRALLDLLVVQVTGEVLVIQVVLVRLDIMDLLVTLAILDQQAAKAIKVLLVLVLKL